MPYTPDEFRAQHIEGCRLDPDHAGACLLDRPFRIRPEGGREYVDEREVEHDQSPEVGRSEQVAPRDEDGAGAVRIDSTMCSSAPRDEDAPPLLDSTDAAVAEVRWIAREARALLEVDDPERRARLVERKRALLDFIAATTGARS